MPENWQKDKEGKGMNAEQFFRLVERMRTAQKQYFKTHMSQYLNESKQLERQVDDEIERVNGILQARTMPRQQVLDFDGAAPPLPPLEPPAG